MRQARLFCPIKWAIDKPEPRNYIQNYKQPIEKSNFNITVNDHAGSRLVRSTVISKSQSRPQGRRFPSHRPGTVNCRLQSICSTPACASPCASAVACACLPAPQRQPAFPGISTTCCLSCHSLCPSLHPSSLSSSSPFSFLSFLSLSPTNRRFP